MVWVKFTDDYPDNAKIAHLTDAAFRLNTTVICWSNRFGTDGFVPEVWIARARPKGDGARLVKELLAPPIGLPDAQPLWHLSTAPCTACKETWGYTARAGGYWIHDHTEYQDKAATWDELREKKRMAGRIGGIRAGQTKRAQALARASAEAERVPQQLLPIKGSTPEARATAEGKHDLKQTASKPVAVPVPEGGTPPQKQASSEGAAAPLKADAVVRAYVEGLAEAGHPPCDRDGKKILGRHAKAIVEGFFSDSRLLGRDWYDPERESQRWLTDAVAAARSAGQGGRNPAFLTEWLERERLRVHEQLKAEDRGAPRGGGLHPVGESVRRVAGGAA